MLDKYENELYNHNVLENVMYNYENIEDDKLSPSRIKIIYAQLTYGDKSIAELSEYYNIPEKIIYGIKYKKLFKNILKDC